MGSALCAIMKSNSAGSLTGNGTVPAASAAFVFMQQRLAVFPLSPLQESS